LASNIIFKKMQKSLVSTGVRPGAPGSPIAQGILKRFLAAVEERSGEINYRSQNDSGGRTRLMQLLRHNPDRPSLKRRCTGRRSTSGALKGLCMVYRHTAASDFPRFGRK
jgi:hypothetical protein